MKNIITNDVGVDILYDILQGEDVALHEASLEIYHGKDSEIGKAQSNEGEV